jgi:hypothetical protein
MNHSYNKPQVPFHPEGSDPTFVRGVGAMIVRVPASSRRVTYASRRSKEGCQVELRGAHGASINPVNVQCDNVPSTYRAATTTARNVIGQTATSK